MNTTEWTKEELKYVEELTGLLNEAGQELGFEKALNILLNCLWAVGQSHGWGMVGAPLSIMLKDMIAEDMKDREAERH